MLTPTNQVNGTPSVAATPAPGKAGGDNVASTAAASIKSQKMALAKQSVTAVAKTLGGETPAQAAPSTAGGEIVPAQPPVADRSVVSSQSHSGQSNAKAGAGGGGSGQAMAAPTRDTKLAPTEIAISAKGQQIIVDAGGGDDKINVAQRKDGGLSVTTNGETIKLTAAESRNLTIRGGAGADRITLDSGVTIGVTIEGGSGKDKISGGAGRDIIRGGAGNDDIKGGRGSDILIGGRGDDSIHGDAGHDYINGGRGSDILAGGAGHDSIRGGAGHDFIKGGLGHDHLVGEQGNDAISGGAGKDKIRGGRGSDTLRGGAGNDDIKGGRGNDYIDGGRGDDRLVGERGNDVMRGGAGNDNVKGGLGNDYIDGGLGNDHLAGQRGDDVIFGGTGKDILSGGPGNNAIRVSTSHDIGKSADVATLVGLVSQPTYAFSLKSLTATPTRHSLSPEYVESAIWAQNELRGLGYHTELQPIDVNIPYTEISGKSYNVIAERRGSEPDPAKRGVVIVTAHLDSVNYEFNSSRAPGVDDNASGSAGVLEIARVLANYPGKHDLRLILFGGEEQGLLGSGQYVEKLTGEERKRIRGVINMDMIGKLNTSEPTVLLEGLASARPLMDELAKAAATHTSLKVERSFKPSGSDHVPFAAAGIPAMLTIEGNDDDTPSHTSRDTIVDYGLAMDIVRMNVAAVATMLNGAGEESVASVSAGADVPSAGDQRTQTATALQRQSLAPKVGGTDLSKIASQIKAVDTYLDLTTLGVDPDAPIFFGSYDWHSSVHAHLAKVIDMEERGRPDQIKAFANKRFSPVLVQEEIKYSGDIPYGWSWLLELDTKLNRHGVSNLTPLAEHFVPQIKAEIEKTIDAGNLEILSMKMGSYPDPNWMLLNMHSWAKERGDMRLHDWAGGKFDELSLLIDWHSKDVGDGDFFSKVGIGLLAHVKIGKTQADNLAWNELLDKAKSSLKDGSFQKLLNTDFGKIGYSHASGKLLSLGWGYQAAYQETGDKAFKQAYTDVTDWAEKNAARLGDGPGPGHWLPNFAVYGLDLPSELAPSATSVAAVATMPKSTDKTNMPSAQSPGTVDKTLTSASISSNNIGTKPPQRTA